MQVIHETFIKDIVDILGDLKDVKNMEELIKRNKKGNNMKSIAQASSNLTLTYPHLIDNSLSIESAAMISKAGERKNAQMLQLLLGAWQSHKLQKGESFDPIAYLKQYHTNLNVDYNVSVDSILDTVDKVIKLAEDAGMCTGSVQSISESEMLKYIKENQIPDNVLPDNISEEGVATFKVRINPKFGNTEIIQERTTHSNGLGYDDNGMIPKTAYPDTVINDKNGSHQVPLFGDDQLLDFARKKQQYNNDKARADYAKQDNEWNQKQRQSTKASKQYGPDVTDQDTRNQQYAYARQREGRDRDKAERDARSQSYKDTLTKLQTSQGAMAQLQNVDVKKANELVGTPIMVTVHVTHDNGSVDPISFLIAVKSKMYSLDSKDIINRVVTKNKDKNFFSKLVKVATGEISFVRDFLFAIDGAKLDALSQSRKGSSSKLWRVLERMALKSKVTRALGKNNDYMAISTLVISQETVDYIKKYSNIDMEKEVNARMILDAYNLLSIVIVDEVNEVAKFIYNTGQDLFEELSFNQLEREASDGSYRKMVNLITKMK